MLGWFVWTGGGWGGNVGVLSFPPSETWDFCQGQAQQFTLSTTFCYS